MENEKPPTGAAEPDRGFLHAWRTMDPGIATMGLVVIGIILAIGVMILLTSPIGALFGGSEISWALAMHGFAATLFVLSATISLYLAWRLFSGRLGHLGDLKWLTSFSAAMSAFTIMFGNWVYTAYRASGGPRSTLLKLNPDFHNIFFEFKEHLALYTLPLMVGVAYTVIVYDKELLRNKYLRFGVAAAIVLGWLALMIVFALGAEVTRLASVK